MNTEGRYWWWCVHQKRSRLIVNQSICVSPVRTYCLLCLMFISWNTDERHMYIGRYRLQGTRRIDMGAAVYIGGGVRWPSISDLLSNTSIWVWFVHRSGCWQIVNLCVCVSLLRSYWLLSLMSTNQNTYASHSTMY